MRAKKKHKQNPAPAHNRLDALTFRLDKRVHIRNRVVGAILLSSTDTASQEDVVDPAQRALVATARAPRDTAIQHCLEYFGF